MEYSPVGAGNAHKNVEKDPVLFLVDERNFFLICISREWQRV